MGVSLRRLSLECRLMSVNAAGAPNPSWAPRGDRVFLLLVQSFSNAVHPLWRSYDQKVAHIFRAEDDD